MVEIVNAVEIINPEIKIDRPRSDGDLSIFIGDFELVTIHYDYRYVDNTTQYRLAETIVSLFKPTEVENG
jgi:hypothetical protein